MRKALRAARANRVFRADEKRIRTENTVIDKGKGGSVWLLFKIADCARMAFYPCTIGDPRGRVYVRAGFEKTCALARANRDFCTDKEHPYRNHGSG